MALSRGRVGEDNGGAIAAGRENQWACSDSYKHIDYRARNMVTANSTSFMTEEEARQAMTTALELLRLVQSLLTDVQRELATPIPDVSVIGVLCRMRHWLYNYNMHSLRATCMFTDIIQKIYNIFKR